MKTIEEAIKGRARQLAQERGLPMVEIWSRQIDVVLTVLAELARHNLNSLSIPLSWSRDEPQDQG